MPVLDPGRGRTKQGYFWAIARDDRPWGGGDPPAVVYTYAPGRGQKHATALLGGYRGILQCDGYGAYKNLADPGRRTRGPRTLAFCWSHVRRGFYDLAKAATRRSPREALRRIAALYRIEADIRGRAPPSGSPHARHESRALVDELRAWFEAQMAKLPARGPTAEAIRYALNHWDGLRAVPRRRPHRDRHQHRRARRCVRLGSQRKNASSAGSDEGGENWAAMASLVETCKLNGVNPQTYFTDLLTRLVNGWPQDRIDELMPWHCASPQNA